MNPADWSPNIPSLGPIINSNLAKRRVPFEESYYKFDEYDNVPLFISKVTNSPKNTLHLWYVLIVVLTKFSS